MKASISLLFSATYFIVAIALVDSKLAGKLMVNMYDFIFNAAVKLHDFEPEWQKTSKTSVVLCYSVVS